MVRAARDLPPMIAAGTAVDVRIGGEVRSRGAGKARAADHPPGAGEGNNWNRHATAETLGINRTTLYKKMKRLGLEDGRFARR